MVGGNIAGKTRVMTTSIVLETSKGNMEQAGLLGMLLLLFSLALVALAALVQRYRRIPAVDLMGEDPPTPVQFPEGQHHSFTVEKGGRKILDGVEIDLVPTLRCSSASSWKDNLFCSLAGLETLEVQCGPRATEPTKTSVLLTPTVKAELMSQLLFPATTTLLESLC